MAAPARGRHQGEMRQILSSLLLYNFRRNCSLSGKIISVGVSKIRQYFFHRAWVHCLLGVRKMRADLYAERKERAREVDERKAQKKASDATTKQLQLRSNIANAELAKCLFINERERTREHTEMT